MRALIATFLCPTQIDRARMLEGSKAIARARTITGASIGASLVLFAPMYGWWTIALFAVAIANIATLDRRVARSQFPELHIAASIFTMQAVVAAAGGLSGGPDSPVLAWIVMLSAFAAARFRGTIVVLVTATGILMLLGVSLGVDAAAFAEHPENVIVSAVLMCSVGAVVHLLCMSDVQHHGAAILDPLTGLLNRASLSARFDELVQQATVTDSAVSVVVFDLDHFKAINDRHGHSHGDVVLRDVADITRNQLRRFELTYRLGGEEFVVLMPGVELAEARDVAERLRQAIHLGRPGGLEVTASFGVAATRDPDTMFEDLFADADGALYRAKFEGRNCVRTTELAPELATGVDATRAGRSAAA